MDYRERCSIMEACIPASEFKHQVVKLHVDMLNEIESLRYKLAEAEKREAVALKDARRYRWMREHAMNEWYGDELLDNIFRV